MNVRASHIGDSPPRPDGFDKVSGRARYVDDLTRPGLLFGATLRSPHAHARVTSLGWRPERAPAGSVCVTAADLPGPNGVKLLDDTWPVLADGVVRHVGEAVALVAAPTRLDAHRALAAIEVEYEPLPPALSWEEAERLEPLSTLELVHGDVDAAMTTAAHVITGEYRTGLQEHIYIECQGMMAWYERDDELVVVGSMQCPYFVHTALVHALGLTEKNVRVRPAAVGGGFGGKEDYPSLLAIHAALLARASARPVKIIYDRHEDIIGTTKRHPSRVRHRSGVGENGELVAMEIDIDLDGGAYRTLSPVVLSRAVLHATGPYRCPNVRVRGRVLRTHTAPNAAFRGFGAPQAQFAAERQLDRIARAIGLDPFTIRSRNVLRPGDRLPTGQVLDDSAAAHLCLEKAAATTRFADRWRELEAERGRRPDGEPLRGIGLSVYFHGAGFTGQGEHRMASPVTVRLDEMGRIEILTAMTDMGQGSIIALPQIAADAAGVALDDVILVDPDTALVPDSGPTVASRTTMVVGGTIDRAVRQLRDRVLAWCANASGVADPSGLRVHEGEVVGPDGSIGSFREVAHRCRAEQGDLELTVRHQPPAWQVFDDETYQGAAYATYAWGADVIEVEVDPDTLEVRPLRATAVCEVGKVIHETLCRGQIEGGTLQGIAYAYLEEIKLADGRYLNDRLATYIIPTIKDTPRIDVHLLERPWEGGPGGAKGIGELPMDGAAPATVQAIENATGIVAAEIPATPERLAAALEHDGAGSAAMPDATRGAAARPGTRRGGGGPDA